MNEDLPPIRVACLCAAWCRLCDAYEPLLREVAAEFEAAGVPLAVDWIDIEDEAELVGDVDVETFPTLLIVDPEQVRFAGPLTPQPETLRRMLRATLLEAGAETRWPAVAPEFVALAQRLRERPPAR